MPFQAPHPANTRSVAASAARCVLVWTSGAASLPTHWAVEVLRDKTRVGVEEAQHPIRGIPCRVGSPRVEQLVGQTVPLDHLRRLVVDHRIAVVGHHVRSDRLAVAYKDDDSFLFHAVARLAGLTAKSLAGFPVMACKAQAGSPPFRAA